MSIPRLLKLYSSSSSSYNCMDRSSSYPSWNFTLKVTPTIIRSALVTDENSSLQCHIRCFKCA